MTDTKSQAHKFLRALRKVKKNTHTGNSKTETKINNKNKMKSNC